MSSLCLREWSLDLIHTAPLGRLHLNQLSVPSITAFICFNQEVKKGPMASKCGTKHWIYKVPVTTKTFYSTAKCLSVLMCAFDHLLLSAFEVISHCSRDLGLIAFFLSSDLLRRLHNVSVHGDHVSCTHVDSDCDVPRTGTYDSSKGTVICGVVKDVFPDQTDS